MSFPPPPNTSATHLKKTLPSSYVSYIDNYGNTINGTPPVAPTNYLYYTATSPPSLVPVTEGYTYIFGNKLVPYPPDGYEYMPGNNNYLVPDPEYYNQVLVRSVPNIDTVTNSFTPVQKTKMSQLFDLYNSKQYVNISSA